jgi:hypothetical protein
MELDVEIMSVLTVGPPRNMWVLTLACGHVAKRPVRYRKGADVSERAPRKVRCEECLEANLDRVLRGEL